MENCIFCKISNNQIPSVKIYEDDKILAFLDITQVTKGHTLIIPKEHAADVFEVSEENLAYIYKMVPKIAKAITNAFNADGINIINNNGKAAGQTVFHYHVHLLPRYNADDGFRAIYTSHIDDYTKDDLQNLAQEIKKNL